MTDEMPRTSEEFAAAVRRVLEERHWSYRRATVATGIDHGTIGFMAIGIVPKRGVVIEWAQALKEPINDWLKLAGYDPIPENLVTRELAVKYRMSADMVLGTAGRQVSPEVLRRITDILEEADCEDIQNAKKENDK